MTQNWKQSMLQSWKSAELLRENQSIGKDHVHWRVLVDALCSPGVIKDDDDDDDDDDLKLLSFKARLCYACFYPQNSNHIRVFFVCLFFVRFNSEGDS